MVYVSSPSILAASRQSVMQAQSSLTTVQNELASGTLQDPGLSLGGRSSQLVALASQQNQLQTLTTTNALASTRLTATSSALDSIRSAASDLLSSLTTAASSSGSSTTIASTAASNLAALTAALNTSVSGQYIFAGQNTAVQPMTTYTSSPASTAKQAVDAAFSSAFGVSQDSSGAASVSASDMQNFLDTSFASLFSGSSYQSSWSSASSQVITSQISPTQSANTSVSANSDAFRQLAQAYTMITEFGGGNLSDDATQAVISSATSLINSAISSLTNMEAGVGTTQSAISDANDSMSSQMSLLASQSDSLDDVDTYTLSTRLSSLQTQIEASYELTAQLQSLSLVNYLS